VEPSCGVPDPLTLVSTPSRGARRQSSLPRHGPLAVETLRAPDQSWQWSVQSVALQTYAKVGNIPFVLHDPVGVRELVLGVGRSDLVDPRAFLERNPYSIAFKEDAEAGVKSVPVVTVRESPPACISLLAGDAVHNLRSSLDLLVWQRRLSPERGLFRWRPNGL
jgi:hypothetical protein